MNVYYSQPASLATTPNDLVDLSSQNENNSNKSITHSNQAPVYENLFDGGCRRILVTNFHDYHILNLLLPDVDILIV